MTNEFKKECGVGQYWCTTDMICKSIQEDAPVNAVGGGQIAGIGVGPKGEPGVNRKKKTASFISFIKRKSNVAS